MAGTDYVVDPTNPLSPIDGNIGKKGAAELRALKAYIAGLAGLPSGSNPYRKNLLINGDFRNGTYFASGGSNNPVANNATYGADRWYTYQSGGATGNMTQSIQQTDGPFTTFDAYLRVLRNAGVAITDSRIRQIIEARDCYRVGGKNVVASFWARKGAGYSAAGSLLNFELSYGSANDQGSASREAGTWTGQTIITTGVTLTGAWQFFTFTPVPIPVTTREIAFSFTPTWVGAAPANDYIEIAFCQLEQASAASEFEYLPKGMQDQLCARFAFALGGVDNNETLGAICMLSATNGRALISFPTQMRVAPSLLTSPTIANFRIGGFVGAAAVTAGFTLFNVGLSSCAVDMTAAGYPGAGGQIAVWQMNGTLAERAVFSAEL